MQIFYFGSGLGELGHYLWEPGMGYAVSLHRPGLTIPWRVQELDCGLCPRGPQVQGQALVHYSAGWSAMAFWDRSEDDRENSCSVFILEGTHSFPEIVRQAQEHFPEVWDRMKFEVVRYTG